VQLRPGQKIIQPPLRI